MGTDRITTDNNCIPVDMAPVGSLLIFGYNVTIGLKSKTAISDVFSIYTYSNQKFTNIPLDLIKDKTFKSDFDNLYEYYKDTQFVKFAEIGPHLFMVFRTGKNEDDIKAFKWLIKGDTLEYKGNRSTHEFVFPEQHEFKWKKTSRDCYMMGDHPHVSIEDIVFVETVGGDLTIKVENNTESGLGIYSEPVDVPNQTLDDAEFYYAMIGNIIVLKILPYQEKNYRYFIYNSKVQEAVRIDALEDSCVLLPDAQGLIFSHGYYLQTGVHKLFDQSIDDLLFEQKKASGNGEDFLYVFFNKKHGAYVLLMYNTIAQKIDTPIVCHGFSIFDNGELCYFKGDNDEKKHHAMQIWQTSFMGSNFESHTENDSFLFKVGNKDIVKAMSECNELLLLIGKDDSYANLYVDIVKKTTDITDAYYWLDTRDAFELISPLKEIHKSAASAISEFEKVSNIKKETNARVEDVEQRTTEIFRHITKQKFDNIDRYVGLLDDLRNIRGEIISLKDLRYVPLNLVEELESSVIEKTEKLSQDCVNFLLKETALDAYKKRVEDIQLSVGKISKVKEADDIADEIVKVSGQLEMLIDIVSNLKIEDATQTTSIINNISEVYSSFNQIKAELKKNRKNLHATEAKAEFNSQLKLIEQGVVNYLDLCDTPSKTEEYLSKLMVQLEEMEGKFSDFDEFIDKIGAKREEVYNAFESKKIALLEARNRRCSALASSAERILKAIQNRVAKFNDVNEIHGYFASDLMIEKVRDVINDLKELDDSVKADDLQSKLKTIKEETVRQLKDRSDLFEDGANIIRFGNHKFSVNNQSLELSMVRRDNDMYYHLTGTNFFEKVTNEAFLDSKDVWDQLNVSENSNVYSAEYLSYQVFKQSKKCRDGSVPTLQELAEYDDANLLAYIQKFMSVRYNEGYSKGIHDNDALVLLRELISIHFEADLLSFAPNARALAEIFWAFGIDKEEKTLLNNNIKCAGIIAQAFPNTAQFEDINHRIEQRIHEFVVTNALFDSSLVKEASEYLFQEISRGDDFILSKEAKELCQKFNNFLRKNRSSDKFKESLTPIKNEPLQCFRMALSWIEAYIRADNMDELESYKEESALTLLNNSLSTKRLVDKKVHTDITSLKGTHALIENNKYAFDFDDFMHKLTDFENITIPKFNNYTQLKRSLVDAFEQDLRLNEFKPRVLTSFVRNKLIDKVYLPLIGNNLAKQIGAEGESKRTDLMGMLLIISPPGYGKTTLMEYIANRLGIIFMKINGPSIGHSITSLDPGEASNAAAREELEKLNLAFEMGDNVMIYLDDIQHCNPEFLQKFISLCDAQRKIEGVYKGKSKTYDFRGKKVCVVMAGNPYTESGDKFKIPDMLANRADIYNIGDIIGNSDEEFKLSYIENSLTSNPILSKLSSKSQKDLYTLIQIAVTGKKDGLDFESNHSPEEVNEYVNILKKLITLRDIILKVNKEYIHSAAQAEEYRTEPPFKLQGSYRNMNKIAEKVLPIMNDKEIETLILSHYENEAQTLTTGAEANILKFKELYEVITEDESIRWEEIKESFRRNNKLKGMGQDQQTSHAILQMEEIAKGLLGIKDVLGNN
ncbi:MAG: DNA repair ATPase [Bacteroidales bacterium]|nr:DNA repair ATPase [Bacteroidales bacterium]